MDINDDLFASRPNKSKETIISVSELNKKVARLLDANLGNIWVQGEISNLTKAASGHWYFSIKDKSASVRAVMFRSRAGALDFVPELGGMYEFYVQASIYEPRGEFQVRVETMRIAGKGDLYAQFLALKDKLAQEGLIDPARRKAIPYLPHKIGVITSLKAAALQDVLAVLSRRARQVPIIVYPAQVQGKEAAVQLRNALEQALSRNEVDVLLIVRGGGSIEDLWCFNDESLARLIASSSIPVISGVGHETDFTIADFVADLRAPTPTAAAELSCTSNEQLHKQIDTLLRQLEHNHGRYIENLSIRLDKAFAKLISPMQRLQLQKHRYSMAYTKLNHTVLGTIKSENSKLYALQQTLQALNPLAVLNRGYAIVRNSQGQLVKNALDLKVTEKIGIEFGSGYAQAQVLKTNATND